jgi:secreted Zn-dependent insulinase-like peptidase
MSTTEELLGSSSSGSGLESREYGLGIRHADHVAPSFYKLLNRSPWGQRKNDNSKVKRKNTNIMIDVKKEIIARHENGVRVSDLGIQFHIISVSQKLMCPIQFASHLVFLHLPNGIF